MTNKHPQGKLSPVLKGMGGAFVRLFFIEPAFRLLNGLKSSVTRVAAAEGIVAGELSLSRPVRARPKRAKIPKLLCYKRFWTVLLLPLALLAGLFSRIFPRATEAIFSQGIYKFLASVLGFISSLFPFSIAEFIILLLPITVILYITISLARAIHRKKAELLIKALATLTALVCVISFSFTVLCGLNYNRLTFAEFYGMEAAPSSTAELKLLCETLAEEVNSLRAQLPEDDRGVMLSGFSSYRARAKFAQSSYGNLGELYPSLSGYTALPKPVLSSQTLSYLNITGIYIPHTLEANVNVDVPEYSIPATMMHELSHHKGYMREQEANFISFLACRKSGNREFQYSGSMMALNHSLNALYSADSDMYYQLIAQLSDAVIRDKAASREYWSGFQGKAAKLSSKVNDVYLKSNSQSSGVKSYGEMVDLLMWYFNQGLLAQ